mmetsp:Transcript_5296/g.6532  ORF Transcript_5296/g.6532 Transcript_5296/m.6532 type:complete len:279 (-) Transcript_5296:204-1040(-)
MKHVVDGIRPVDTMEVLLLKPEEGPFRKEGFDDVVVVVRVEEGDVRQFLKGPDLVPFLNHRLQSRQHLQGAAALFEGGHSPAFHIKDRVDHVHGQRPTFSLVGTVQVELFSDGEVELTLERMEHEVNLVKKENAFSERLQDVRQFFHLTPMLLDAVFKTHFSGFCESLQSLNVHKLDRLERRRSGDHDTPVLSRIEQSTMVGWFDDSTAVEGQGVDPLRHDRRKCLPHLLATHLKKGLGHDGEDEALSIGEHESEERSHNGGLSCPHNHLLDLGATIF